MKHLLFIVLIFTTSSLLGMEQPDEARRQNQQVCYFDTVPMEIKIEILIHLFARQDIPFLTNPHDGAALVWPFLRSTRRIYCSDIFQNQLVERITKIYKVLPVHIWLDLPTPVSKKYLQSIQSNIFAYRAQGIASNGFPAQIRMLLDVYPPDKNMVTHDLVLKLAESNIEARCLRLLLSKGVCINAKDEITGDNALHKIVRSCFFNHENIALKKEQLKVLLDYGVDIDHRNSDERQTPLELFSETIKSHPYKFNHLYSSLGTDLERAELKKRLNARGITLNN